MRTSLWEIQKALWDRLSKDSELSNIVTGIHDSVGEDIPKPYCTISEPDMVPFETKSSFGEETTLVIHVWSDYDGRKETIEILNLILKALSKPLSVDSGFSLFKFKVERMQVLKDIDGVTNHGILRLRFFINN
jgi:Protein of unknown function (DUF3168)